MTQPASDNASSAISPVLASVLRCPGCNGDLDSSSTALRCKSCKREYPIKDGIPRFVEDDRYTRSFSIEWKRHATTQFDSVNNRTASEEKLRRFFPFPLESLKGKLVLDAGVGSGRLSEVLLKYGARVVGVDLSYAIETARDNLASYPDCGLAQADILSLPLKEAMFDVVMCIGVLHHTPDPKRGFLELARRVKPGGTFGINLYAAYNRSFVMSTKFFRRVARALPTEALWYGSYAAIPLSYLYKIPVLGGIGRNVLPIGDGPSWQWVHLDTFDWYSPHHVSFHTHGEVQQWFDEAGFEQTHVAKTSSVAMTARRRIDPPGAAR
jgi:2-polyprenyl-3-methyl-5-hydroxy-6-metoxy-1,4-benzoquinol methylase